MVLPVVRLLSLFLAAGQPGYVVMHAVSTTRTPRHFPRIGCLLERTTNRNGFPYLIYNRCTSNTYIACDTVYTLWPSVAYRCFNPFVIDFVVFEYLKICTSSDTIYFYVLPFAIAYCNKNWFICSEYEVIELRSISELSDNLSILILNYRLQVVPSIAL